jgi:hypothetical protein
MLKKHKRFFTTATLMIFCCVSLFGQGTTGSPYSYYGLGDLESDGLSSQASMGDVKYGVFSSNNINPANPATYALLKQPTFDIGLKSVILTIENSSAKQSSNDLFFKNFSFLFPITKWWSFSFGAMPHTKVGYDLISYQESDNLGKVTYTNKGKGGLNRVYVGNGFKIINDSLHTLTVGFNANYLFGSINQQRRLEVEDPNALRTLFNENKFFSDFNFDIGLYYKLQLNKNLNISAGATYTIGDSIKTHQTNFIFTYSGLTGNERLFDTVVYAVDTFKTYLPHRFGFGFGFQLNEKLLVGIDFSSMSWSKLSFGNEQQQLLNRNQIAVGLEYVPNIAAVNNIQKTTRYRAGFRYGNSHLNINNQSFNEFGMTFGVGIPITKSQSNTMFNFGIEYGKRGNTQNNLVSEQFTNFNIGFSMTPHKFDQWFVRRKID